MRISIDPRDPGYGAFRDTRNKNQRALVLLDGVQIGNVRTADEEKRFIVRETGVIKNGEYLTTVEHGTVSILIEDL